MLLLKRMVLSTLTLLSSLSFGGLAQRDLLTAIQNSKIEEVYAALSKGALIDGLSLKSPSPIHEAAALGQELCLEVLIKEGADVNSLWVDKGEVKTALMLALKAGHKSCVNLLLSKGAKISVKEEEYLKVTSSQTMKAAGQSGDLDLLRSIVARIPLLKKQKRSYYLQALYGAYEKGHTNPEYINYLKRRLGKLSKKELYEIRKLIFKNG